MKNSNSRLRDGDTVQTEWSQISYDLWCRESAAQFVSFPEKRIVDLYEVVRSVIADDLTPAEQAAVRLHWYNGLSVSDAARQEGVSRACMYRSLNRGKEKIRLVLKHLIDSEVYRIPAEM